MKRSNLLVLFAIFVLINSVGLTADDKENTKYLDFELPKLSSNQNFRLSTLVGKKLVLLHFWTTWCPFCRAEIPALNDLYKKYKDRGFEIISVNIKEPKSALAKFVSSKGISYTVLLDQKAKVADLYGIRGIPTNFVINLKGEIIFKGHEVPDEKIIENNLPVKPQKDESKSKNKKGK